MDKITYEPIKKLQKSPIIPQSGWIALCAHCGEQVGNSQKYCPNCRTKPGRKEIFDANMAIIKERQKQGLPVPVSLPNPA